MILTMKQGIGLLALWLICYLPSAATATKGGELASLSVPLFTSLANATHRQNMCHRNQLIRAGELELRNALSGLALQPLMALGDFFNYNVGSGIDREDPGLMADLMDSLAERANFTWRDSFAVMEAPEVLNQSWTNMLLWGIENYDVAVNWWDQSVERMEKGAAYIEPWFDGSLILIDQEDPPVDVDTIDWFNWTSPFEPAVWALIIGTIFVSALVYQVIEHLSGEREDRPMANWCSDNLYLSSLNFTQNFEYAPNSAAGRIFAVSMAMWSLVLTATYTANLASLFVQEQRPALVVDSIDQAILLEIPICTMGLTNSDSIIQERYKGAKRVPKLTELAGYQALRRGECGLVAAYKDNWLGYQGNKEYNPECDLEWVGRVVAPIKSGFAVNSDAGHLCSSLIRDVLNLHMTELMIDGTLEKAWTKHRAKTKDQDCVTDDSDADRRRLLKTQPQSAAAHSRRLKGGGRAAAAGGASGDNANASLTLQQMLGTFALHWVSMLFAILVSVLTNWYQKRMRRLKRKPTTEHVIHRRHGPIVGLPPKLNTSVMIRDGGWGDSLDDSNSYNADKNLNDTKERSSQRGDKTAGTSDDEAPSPNKEFSSSSNCDWTRSQPDWRRSHSKLQQKQEDLSHQMSSVLGLLQDMRNEQQQLLHQVHGHQQQADQSGGRD